MWSEFAQEILDWVEDTEDSFSVNLYRPTRTVSAAGEIQEQLLRTAKALATWSYEDEMMELEDRGDVYRAKPIFFLSPEYSIRQGDIIGRPAARQDFWRCRGIADLQTHLELTCEPPDTQYANIIHTCSTEFDTVIVSD